MHYVAEITQEGKYLLAEFPDCPGCQTFADCHEDILSQAQDALTGWLESHMGRVTSPPRPRHHHARRGVKLVQIEVPASLAIRLELRWSREDQQMSQAQLARKVGVSQQHIAKLEGPQANPTVTTLERVAEGLGRHLVITLGDSEATSSK